jgi:membrane protease YdiL (CAAX protease family)
MKRATPLIWRALWLILAPRHVFVLGFIGIVISRRWQPLAEQCLHVGWLAVGIAAGLAVYLASTELIQGRFVGIRLYLATVRNSLGGWRPTRRRVVNIIVRVTFEEVLWRGTIQALFPTVWIAVSAVAAVFTFAHVYYSRINSRKMSRSSILEFFLFSVFLGTVYAATRELLAVIGVHLVRNVLIDAGCLPARKTHPSIVA